MTQLDNIRSSRPMVRFPSRCGSANLRRTPKFSASSDEVPNTFMNAVAWISRHDAMLRKFVHLVQQLPNLIDEPELMYFRLYMSEQYQDKVNSEQEKAVERILQSPHARRAPSSYSLLSPSKIEVYVSGEVCETQWTNTDFITRELAQHFKVQTDPPLPRYPGFQTEEDLVMSCNVMIFVLTDSSLADSFCVHQLRTAIANHVPIVLIREPEGTDIPDSIGDDTPIVLNRPVTALTDIADQTPVLFLDDSPKPVGKDQNRGVNKSVSRINSAKESTPQNSILLMDWLKRELSSALLFSFEHRAICMGRVVTRVKNMAFGETLVDGFGNTLPTELPLSPKQLDELGRNFHDSKIADMAESLRATPTSSLWGGIPNCGRCGEELQLPARLTVPTPQPTDPTLSKFLHHSQKCLQGQSDQKTTPDRPSTAPSNLSSSRAKKENSLGSNDKKLSDIKKSGHVDKDAVTSNHETKPTKTERSTSRPTSASSRPTSAASSRAASSNSRPPSARSVTFSDTDQVVEFSSPVVEFDTNGSA
ncbi:uncharacterized protein LOC134819280 [Bolinopsis microptera]|uniref:uncharacterized protein LOC134819280 n=1 Tax=Bolinopsis microptera TaxID=2820187 RepID=UPI0030792579